MLFLRKNKCMDYIPMSVCVQMTYGDHLLMLPEGIGIILIVYKKSIDRNHTIDRICHQFTVHCRNQSVYLCRQKLTLGMQYTEMFHF